jgi:hypothetical protein
MLDVDLTTAVQQYRSRAGIARGWQGGYHRDLPNVGQKLSVDAERVRHFIFYGGWCGILEVAWRLQIA